jgi:hypothetical protein
MSVCGTILFVSACTSRNSKSNQRASPSQLFTIPVTFKGEPKIWKSEPGGGILDVEWKHSHADHTAGGSVRVECYGDETRITVTAERPELESHFEHGWPKGQSGADDLDVRSYLMPSGKRLAIPGIQGQTFYCHQGWLFNDR